MGRINNIVWRGLCLKIGMLYLLVLSTSVMSVNAEASQSKNSIIQAQFDWSLYQSLLTDYLQKADSEKTYTTYLNYAKLKNDPRIAQQKKGLQLYQAKDQSQNERIAFYLNAYNFFTVALMAEHYPVESIKDIGSFFKRVWHIEVGEIGGKPVTLSEIEHEILRPLNDARIHFGLVCASLSCPNLRMEIYRADKVGEQLDDQVRVFLANSRKGLLIEEGKRRTTLYLSKLFDWFEEDFDPDGGVMAFIERYHAIPDDVDKVRYLDYQWSPNNKSFN